MTSSELHTKESVVQVAGRGVLWIAMAKAYFMVGGYVMEFGLPHFFTPALFGVWKLVIGAASVLNNTIITGTIQGVSKFISERNADDGVSRSAFRMQLAIGGGVALAFFLAAPLIAKFERDISLVPYLRGTAAITFCYALYAVFVGAANGLRRFHVQAGLDMLYSTLKVGLVMLAAGLGFGVGGAVGAFTTAAAAILLVASRWVGLGKSKTPFPASTLVRFMGQLMVYTLLLNVVFLLDLFLLKRFAAEASGLQGAAAAELSSQSAGYYAAAQTLARIPYQGILAVAFVVFPLVSRAVFEQDRAATKAYVRQTLRFTLVFGAAIAVVFMANPGPVIDVPYPREYVRSADVLMLLAPAMVMFSLFAVACTILNSAGRTGVALVLVGGLLLGAISACFVSFGLLGAELGPPLSTALGVAVANFLGGLVALYVLKRQLGQTLPIATAARVLLAMSAAYAAGRALPDGGSLWTLVECCLVGLTFLAVLLIARELSVEDQDRIRRIFARRRGPG